MGVTTFTQDRTLARDFIRLGYAVYEGDQSWIPPLRREVERLLSPGFSFYRKPGTDHRHFLAVRGGHVVGRATASLDPDLRDEDGRCVGAIGLFEVVDDYGAARELLESAVGWLAEAGADRVWGPLNFDIWHGYRFMTGGFERDRFLGEPFNKPYYPEFFSRFGFEVKREWVSVDLENRDAVQAFADRWKTPYRQFTERGYRFESVDLGRFSDEVERLRGLVERSYSGFPGFVPIGPGEFAEVFSVGRRAIRPELFRFTLDECGRTVGFTVCFLDLADAVRTMRGGTGPVAVARFLRRRRHADRVIYYMTGTVQDGSRARSGAGRAGFHSIARATLDQGYHRVVIALMARTGPVPRMMGESAAMAERTYALFEYVP